MRKVIAIGNVLGIGLPKPLLHLMQAEKGDYLEVFLMDERTIVLRKPTDNERTQKRYDYARASNIVAKYKDVRVPTDLKD